MVIFLALLVVVQPPAQERSAADPIVITTNRLDRVRFNLSINRLTGAFKCRIARSSGVDAIDAYICDSGKYCAKISSKTRAAIEQCMAERKQAYLEQFRLRPTG